MPIGEQTRFIQLVEGMLRVVDVLSPRLALALMSSHPFCKTYGREDALLLKPVTQLVP
jgi:hypothetical protein